MNNTIDKKTIKESSKKILVSDYDQTFYLNDEDIKRNKKAVKNFRDKGNIFIIATGRSFLDFKNKVNMYDIDYDYVILNHGATILDKNDNIIFNFPIYNEVIDNIKNDICLEESIKNFCCSELESRIDFDYGNLTKINVKYNNKEKAMQVNTVINNKYSKYVVSYYVNTNSIEIISSKTNKSNAIKLLIKKLCIDNKNVYSIGDVSKEICGGPHVKSTSELGHFKIIKEEASSAGVRRIKAILE